MVYLNISRFKHTHSPSSLSFPSSSQVMTVKKYFFYMTQGVILSDLWQSRNHPQKWKTYPFYLDIQSSIQGFNFTFVSRKCSRKKILNHSSHCSSLHPSVPPIFSIWEVICTLGKTAFNKPLVYPWIIKDKCSLLYFLNCLFLFLVFLFFFFFTKKRHYTGTSYSILYR